MKEPVRSLAYICTKCHQPVIAERTVFSLCVGPSRLSCPCGGSALELEPGEASITLTVPCDRCQKEHRVTVSERAFLYQRALALSCQSSGLDCCYVGEEGPVFAAMERLEQAMDLLPKGKEGTEEAEPEQGQFLNETVMQECLEELKELAARGGISCSCGEKRWSLRIHYAALELSCAGCGGRLRIPAATQEDLTDLCCKTRLEIAAKQN